MKDRALYYVRQLSRRYPALGPCVPDLEEAIDMILRSFRRGGKLLICGNGGSAADSQHIVGELMKGFVLRRNLNEGMRAQMAADLPDGEFIARHLQGALPVLSLVGETALQTAFANDETPVLGFAQQVWGYGGEGDVLLAITTSCNSENVLYAAETAHFKGLKVIGLTGETGGRLAPCCDVCVRVPATEPFEVQEYHLPVYHALCLAIEAEVFGEPEAAQPIHHS